MKTSSLPTKNATARRGGRPSRRQAEQIEGQILEIARDLFFTQGYGTTSIEMIAKKAGMSKRTFYHRFEDKADIFRAVVHHVIESLRPSDTADLFKGQSFEKILERLAQTILNAALSPQALALHRLVLAEATRFPELALAMNQQGTRQEAVTRIAALLKHKIRAKRSVFAAEQFLQMVVSLPQRRALGLGKPMNSHELKVWARDTVHLFLNGCREEVSSP